MKFARSLVLRLGRVSRAINRHVHVYLPQTKQWTFITVVDVIIIVASRNRCSVWCVFCVPTRVLYAHDYAPRPAEPRGVGTDGRFNAMCEFLYVRSLWCATFSDVEFASRFDCAHAYDNDNNTCLPTGADICAIRFRRRTHVWYLSACYVFMSVHRVRSVRACTRTVHRDLFDATCAFRRVHLYIHTPRWRYRPYAYVIGSSVMSTRL